MPKPMLRQPQTQQQSNTILSATQEQQQSKQSQKMEENSYGKPAEKRTDV